MGAIDMREHRVDLLRGANVHCSGFGGATLRADRSGSVFTSLNLAAADNDMCAIRGQEVRNGKSYAMARTRDECDTPMKIKAVGANHVLVLSARWLSALEFGTTSLPEGGDALGEIAGSHRLHLQCGFQFELFSQGIGRTREQRLLGQCEGLCRAAGQLLGNLPGHRRQLGCGEDAPDQT